MRGCLRRTAAGEPYFEVDGRRIFFVPEGDRVDEAAALSGAMLIIRESFFDPCDFFWGPVTTDPGDVVLDLGGNLGTSAMRFAALVGAAGRVYSFEPVFASLLARNVAGCGLDNVELVPVAVGDAVGQITFNVTPLGIDSRITHKPPGADRHVTLPVTTLDHFVAERGLDRLDFIKLDIEGAEEMALRGGEQTLRRFRPRMTIASYHTDPGGEKQHPRLMCLLREWGFNTREVPGRRIYAW